MVAGCLTDHFANYKLRHGKTSPESVAGRNLGLFVANDCDSAATRRGISAERRPGTWSLRAVTHRPDETMSGIDVRVGSRKLFHLKRSAAAALALDSGHRGCRRGPATSPRTRPR